MMKRDKSFLLGLSPSANVNRRLRAKRGISSRGQLGDSDNFEIAICFNPANHFAEDSRGRRGEESNTFSSISEKSGSRKIYR